MRVRYGDPFVRRLGDDIGALVDGNTTLRQSVESRLRELATGNAPSLREYWSGGRSGVGIPDSAFRDEPPSYLIMACGMELIARTPDASARR